MQISIDSRTIQPGDYFIPIKGPNYDGHQFINEVIKKGGKVLDVDIKKYAKKYRQKLSCQIIAVTGSAGKTTVKDMLYAILSQKFKVAKTQENENNEIGVPLTILRADFTTEILIVEMAMRNTGEIAELAKIVRPTHAVVTNIGLSHIEFLKTPKKIAKAKSEIFRNPLAWESGPRYAFLNMSSPYYSLLQTKAGAKGYKVLASTGQNSFEQNINLCYQIGEHFGLTIDEIKQGLGSYVPSEHRLSTSKIRGITIIDDTYNANPDGVRFALEYLSRFKGRKILVLSDMLELGECSEEAHLNIKKHAIEANVSIIFTFGKRSSVIESSTEALWAKNYSDKNSLNSDLIKELKSGDAVLIKGSRGLKMEETVAFLQEKL
jgi:UDP-N-acetylmuramoyl-tripeptide--D-alanyl-D-alanine ligase